MYFFDFFPYVISAQNSQTAQYILRKVTEYWVLPLKLFSLRNFSHFGLHLEPRSGCPLESAGMARWPAFLIWLGWAAWAGLWLGLA